MLRRMIEDGDVGGAEPAAPEILTKARRVRRHSLFERLTLRDAAGEGARHGAALALSRHQFERQAGLHASLVDDALAHDGHGLAHRARIEVAQVRHRVDTEADQLRQRSAANAPQLAAASDGQTHGATDCRATGHFGGISSGQLRTVSLKQALLEHQRIE